MPVLTMLRTQLKLLFRNRLAFVLTILVPIVLTYLFSLSASSDTMHLGVADQSRSQASRILIHQLRGTPNVSVVSLKAAALRQRVANQSLGAGVIIPKDYAQQVLQGRQPRLDFLKLHTDAESAQLAAIIQNTANNELKLASDARHLSSSLHVSAASLLASFHHEQLNRRTTRVIDAMPDASAAAQKEKLFNQFLAMFVWFIVIQGLRTIIAEKENGTFARMQASSLRYGNFLAVKLVAVFCYAGSQLALSLLLGPLLFKTGPLNQIGQTAVVYAAYLFALIGLTLLLVPLLKNQQQFTILATMLVVLTGLLGGSFFSVQDYAPPLIQTISQFMPESWAIGALNGVAVSGQSMTALASTLLLLLGVGIGGLLLSALQMSRSIHKKA
ncbi:MAG: ABC transporter permease [Sporolactobacillus sp.]